MASGKPDYHNDSIISGKHLATFVPVGVDVNGNMLAIMQGDFGGVLQTIAVDAAGRMIANLGAQDMPVVTISNTPGDPVHQLITENFLGIGDATPIDIIGNGLILGGYMQHTALVSHKTCGFSFWVDGVICPIINYEDMKSANLVNVPNYFIKLTCYDDTNFMYTICFTSGIYFKTSFRFKIYERVGAGDFLGFLLYTLNP